MTEYACEDRPLRVRDMPVRLQPREEIDRLGVGNVSDDVLLALVLRSGVKGTNVVDLAGRLLRKYGSLTGLAAAPLGELMQVRGVGRVKAQVLKAALEIGKRLTEESSPSRQRVRAPDDAARLVRDAARGRETEVVWVLLLDTKNYVKGRPIETTSGLLDASLVHPREVFREAVRAAAAGVVVVHNHPSGDPSPSAEDLRITRQLLEAGRVVDIRLLDHIILGAPRQDGERDFVSLREAGVIDFG